MSQCRKYDCDFHPDITSEGCWDKPCPKVTGIGHAKTARSPEHDFDAICWELDLPAGSSPSVVLHRLRNFKDTIRPGIITGQAIPPTFELYNIIGKDR